MRRPMDASSKKRIVQGTEHPGLTVWRHPGRERNNIAQKSDGLKMY